MAKIPQDKQIKLDNKQWLIEQHVNRLYSIKAIAAEVGVTPASVVKAFKKHGISSPSQQALREASNKRKYGVTNPGAVSEFRAKALTTMTGLYGGHVWAYAGKREERNATCLEKYGDINVGKTEYTKAAARATNLLKYNRLHRNQLHISTDTLKLLSDYNWMLHQHAILKKPLTQIANELGFGGDITTVMNSMRRLGIDTLYFQHSTAEKDIVDFIKMHLPDTEIIENSRSIISPKELDVYIPALNLAIEYCGVYWHGEQHGKTRSYHRNKLHACRALGIRLITIFEDEWVYNKPLVETKLLSIIGRNDSIKMNARGCVIKQITTNQKRDFFNQYHIQGDGPGSITYGLYDKDCLVGAMAFIANSNGKFNLNRYATSCSVRGGFSKLLSHFKKTHAWAEIVSFADLRWSEGGLYEDHGFKLHSTLPPDYSYIINGKRAHKFNFRRKYLSKRLNHFDPALSEWENCKANNIDRIWDCGKARYVATNVLQGVVG